MSNPTVKEIVAGYLKANGYDGLWNEWGECGCTVDALIPCIGDSCDDCRAGYKVVLEDGESGIGPREVRDATD